MLLLRNFEVIALELSPEDVVKMKGYQVRAIETVTAGQPGLHSGGRSAARQIRP